VFLQHKILPSVFNFLFDFVLRVVLSYHNEPCFNFWCKGTFIFRLEARGISFTFSIVYLWHYNDGRIDSLWCGRGGYDGRGTFYYPSILYSLISICNLRKYKMIKQWHNLLSVIKSIFYCFSIIVHTKMRGAVVIVIAW
jgi:hypothetical protein